MNEMKNTPQNKPVSGDSALEVGEPQLAKLGSVLNGLQHGASAMQQHICQAMAALKAGTYKVDASAVSRLLIRECLQSKSNTAGQD